MPKSKKPAGGRPAKNFEPRYGAKTSFQDRKRRPGEASAGKPGSKSAGHRGHRAEQTSDAVAKGRWTAQERVGRDEARGIRNSAHGRDDRAERSRDWQRARRFRARQPAGTEGRQNGRAVVVDDAIQNCHG